MVPASSDAVTPRNVGAVTGGVIVSARCPCIHVVDHAGDEWCWVERHFGYGVARAYAGHTDSAGPATTTYIKANFHDVATTLAAMTGQPTRSPP